MADDKEDAAPSAEEAARRQSNQHHHSQHQQPQYKRKCPDRSYVYHKRPSSSSRNFDVCDDKEFTAADMTYLNAIAADAPDKLASLICDIEIIMREMTTKHESLRTQMSHPNPILTLHAIDSKAALEALEINLGILRKKRAVLIECNDLRRPPPSVMLTRSGADRSNFSIIPASPSTAGPASQASSPVSVDGTSTAAAASPPSAKIPRLASALCRSSSSSSSSDRKVFGTRWNTLNALESTSAVHDAACKPQNRTIKAQRKQGEMSIARLLQYSTDEADPLSPQQQQQVPQPTSSDTTSLPPTSISSNNDNEEGAADVPIKGHTVCPKCGAHALELDQKHGTVVCNECGRVAQEHVTSEVSYGKVMPEVFEQLHCSGYKPPNHMAEIVAQFQGKRRTCAPDFVIDLVRNEVTKYAISNDHVTVPLVRSFLKKFKNGNQYYKFCAEIAYKISGIPPPYMNPMQEELIFSLFPETVKAYQTSPRYLARKANRVGRIKNQPNNMNYNYVFYKLCQLCGFVQFLPYIKLPKSAENIMDNDRNGWKHVCEVNGWRYIPTL